MAITDVQVRNLKPKARRYVVWDGEGFGVRVGPSGKKAFIFMYRFDGKPRMMTLGKYPKMDLATARLKKAEAEEKVSKGEEDPGETATITKRVNREAPIVAELVEEYLEKWAKPRKRSWQEDERILKFDVVPVWGNLKAKAITRRNVITLLDGIIERGAPIAANRTLAVIRKMFNFAVGRDVIPATPCAAITRPAPENRRDRVLTDAEIKALWNELPNAKMIELTRLAVKFQLATAQRIGEVAAAEWPEIDLDGKVWTIPAEKAKNGMPHRVPLSPLATELLKAIKVESRASTWLFPSRRKTVGHILPTAIGHALNVAIRDKKIGIDHATPHDLRRTAASKMTEAGIPRLVVGKILNHAESGVTSVYDRHGYDNEKRQALETWARKLEEIITGRKESKVVPLARKEKR